MSLIQRWHPPNPYPPKLRGLSEFFKLFVWIPPDQVGNMKVIALVMGSKFKLKSRRLHNNSFGRTIYSACFIAIALIILACSCAWRADSASLSEFTVFAIMLSIQDG